MTPGRTVRFRSEALLRSAARAAWARESAVLRSLLPGADLQHVGSTAIPGSVTKGDLDIQVRVAAERFEHADGILAGFYRRDLQSARLPGTFAAFTSPGRALDVGILLTSIHGALDVFWRFREVLLARADLRAELDAIKLAHQGSPLATYRAAKAAFFHELRRLPEYREARCAAREHAR